MSRWCYSLCLLLVLLPLKTLGQSPEIVLDSSESVDLLYGVEGLYYADSRDASSIKNEYPLAPSAENISGFLAKLTPVETFNVLDSGAYWFYAVIENPTDIESWVLNPSSPMMERIHLFLYREGGIQQISGGYQYSSQYPSHFGVDFDLASSQKLELLIYMQSSAYSMAPTFEVVSRDNYIKAVSMENSLLIGCFGAIGILCLYNAFVGFSTRDKSFIFYAVYLFSVLIAWFTAFDMFPGWYSFKDFTAFRAPFFLTITFNILYYNYFLELPSRHPRLSKSSYVIAFISLVMALTPSWYTPLEYMLICGVISALWIFSGLFSGIFSYYKGYKPARYFVLAFVVLFTAVGLLIVLPLSHNNTFKNGYVITLVAQTLDMLLLSLALADRINIFREQKEEALTDSITIKNNAIVMEHEANLKLQQALDLSEEESKRKTEFLTLMSHELRTPLHSIISSVDQWDEAEEFSMKSDLISFIGYGAFRLKSQIDNLVLFAETDDTNLQSNSQVFEIRPLLEKLCRGVAGLVHERVEFHYLPSEATGKNKIPVGFNSDAYLIEHLIRSVLENACKNTEFGRVEFIVAWNDKDSALKIDIIDTGCGMTMEQQKHMFNAFVQVSRGLDRKS
jgi:signal transduction histidine kinase